LFTQYFTSRIESPEYILAPLPLNLLYVASFIRSKGLDCKICELGGFKYADALDEGNGKVRCGISDADITAIIEREKPKIIGVGCVYTQHFWDIPPIARLIKKVNPDIKVVLGGNHATAFADQILKEPSVDYVVRGEGELTFLELCNYILTGNGDAAAIEGITYRDKSGEIKATPSRKLIKHLDELPMPDYSLIDLEKYATPADNRSQYIMRYPLVGIMTSRGCPGKCVFCTVKTIWGRTWRARSAKHAVDEIELLVKKYGVREISFLDDSVSVSRMRWAEICNEIIRRKLNIKWTTPNGIAYWTLDNELLKLMKKAGCYRITFGIESGNEETKKFIGKEYPLSQAAALIKYANKIGLWTITSNVIGFPYEDKKSIQDTVDFAKKSGTDFAVFNMLAPHLASDVYKFFKKEGLLNFDSVFSDNWLDDDKYKEMFRSLYIGGFATKYITAEELKKLHFQAYRSFMIYRTMTYILNPLHILRKIHSLEDFTYVMRMLFTGMTMFLKNFVSSKNFMKKSVYNLFYKRQSKKR